VDPAQASAAGGITRKSPTTRTAQATRIHRPTLIASQTQTHCSAGPAHGWPRRTDSSRPLRRIAFVPAAMTDRPPGPPLEMAAKPPAAPEHLRASACICGKTLFSVARSTHRSAPAEVIGSARDIHVHLHC